MLKINTGQATKTELLALKAWLASGKACEQAFQDARQSWKEVGAVGQAWRAAHPVSAARPHVSTPSFSNRRKFLGAAFSAAGATAVCALVFPPAGLWPSVFELGSDYRTVTGEQRHIELAGGVVLELNTQSSLNVQTDESLGGAYHLKLVSGEVLVSSEAGRRDLRIVAGKGVTLLSSGEVELRQIEGRACLTCLRGTVQFEHGAGRWTLQPGQQVLYDDGGAHAVQLAGTEMAAAWRRGVLVFRDTPLADAVAEINRYRPGRVVLLSRELGERKVTGKFQIARLDLAIDRIQEAFGVVARRWPGDVILLG